MLVHLLVATLTIEVYTLHMYTVILLKFVFELSCAVHVNAVKSH